MYLGEMESILQVTRGGVGEEQPSLSLREFTPKRPQKSPTVGLIEFAVLGVDSFGETQWLAWTRLGIEHPGDS